MVSTRLASLTVTAALAVAGANTVFQDTFGTPGRTLDLSKWTTVTGDASFLGRTQLANWVSGSGQFVVANDGAHLVLNTFNPTGSSLYGTQGNTDASFQPTASSTIQFDTRLQLTSLQPGIVYGMYLYGCAPALCATQHDEIDIELLTNSLQPGGTPQVELNRYANEPLGAGNGGLVNLPAGFDALAAHDWTIRWSLSQLRYLVDGVLLASFSDHVAQAPMQVNEIAWGPAADWPAAFSSSLQPAGSAAQNQAFTALLTSVRVCDVSAPEPGIFRLLFIGSELVAGLTPPGFRTCVHLKRVRVP